MFLRIVNKLSGATNGNCTEEGSSWAHCTFPDTTTTKNNKTSNNVSQQHPQHPQDPHHRPRPSSGLLTLNQKLTLMQGVDKFSK